MTPERVTTIYAELDTLAVTLEQRPELGSVYLLERLMECRRKQDRISEILVLINRELSVTRCAARTLRASIDVIGRSKDTILLRAELQPYVDDEDTLKYLLASVRLRRENLRATSSDIRVMVNVVDQLRKLGEVQPPPEKPQHQMTFREVTQQSGEMNMDESEWPEPVPPKPPKVSKKKVPVVPAMVDEAVDLDKIF